MQRQKAHATPKSNYKLFGIGFAKHIQRRKAMQRQKVDMQRQSIISTPKGRKNPTRISSSGRTQGILYTHNNTHNIVYYTRTINIHILHIYTHITQYYTRIIHNIMYA